MHQNSVLKSVIQPRPAPAPAVLKPILSMVVNEMGDERSGNDPEDLEEMLAALVENAPVAMAMFDRQMRYVLANRQWISEFGLQDALPLVGRSQFEVFPNLHPGWRSVYDRGFQGHIVRSEHDVTPGPNGKAMIFRWEVRPWRRKRDAAVGGLMVTCESFSRMGEGLAEAPEPADGETPVAPPAPAAVAASPTLIDCHLPMVLLDADGVILETNQSAMELSLAHGIQEGASHFWDVFGSEGHDMALRLHILKAVKQVVNSLEPATPTIRVTQTGSEPLQIITWGATRHPLPGGHTAALLVGVIQEEEQQGYPPTPLAPQFAKPVPAPAAATKPDSVWLMEKRHLEDEINSLMQETKLLQGVEQAFKRRELRQREVLDCMPCGLLVLDERGRPIFHNVHVRDLFGHELSAGESVEDWLIQACVNESHREEVSRLWLESVWRRQLTKVVSLSTADGLLKHFEFRPAPLPNNGGLLVTIHDVTDTCRLEEMLRGAEAKLRTLLHESPLPVVMTDPSGAIFDVNAAAETLLGHPKSELRRTGIDDWLSPESGLARRTEAKEWFAAGPRGNPTGKSFPVTTVANESALLKLAIIHDADSVPHAVAHFFELLIPPAATPSEPAAPIVTQSPAATRAEQALLKTNAQGRIVEWSPAGTLHFGWSADEAKQRSVHQLFKPSDATGFYNALAMSGRVEWVWFGKDGRKGCDAFLVRRNNGLNYEIELSLPPRGSPAPLATAAGVATFIIGPTGSSPWPVADLERERLLLTETHHRIKNHLQLLISLLNLQSNSLESEGARDALRTSQNRVRAIAALHQHLYQLALGQQPSLRDFIQELSARLRECYELSEQTVSISIDVSEHRLREEWFMPVALILNEALSNALQHGGGAGAVQVRLFAADDQFMHLTVEDSGPGLPEKFDAAASQGLGLKISGVFANQMQGRISIVNTKSVGMLFDLRFPMGCVDN